VYLNSRSVIGVLFFGKLPIVFYYCLAYYLFVFVGFLLGFCWVWPSATPQQQPQQQQQQQLSAAPTTTVAFGHKYVLAPTVFCFIFVSIYGLLFYFCCCLCTVGAKITTKCFCKIVLFLLAPTVLTKIKQKTYG
jgi:hypothetical protein